MSVDREVAVRGAVAGAIGTATMAGVGLLARRAFADPAQPMKTHPEQVVERLYELAGHSGELDIRTRRRRGDLIHYAFGAFQGAVFAHLVRDRDVDPWIAGPAFAAALWVVGFCGYLPALRMHTPPWRWRRVEFLFTCAPHTAYGVGLALSLRALEGQPARRDAGVGAGRGPGRSGRRAPRQT